MEGGQGGVEGPGLGGAAMRGLLSYPHISRWAMQDPGRATGTQLRQKVRAACAGPVPVAIACARSYLGRPVPGEDDGRHREAVSTVGGGGIVIGQSEAGFVAAINRVAAEPGGGRELLFQDLGWGDAEAAELRLALQYAAAKCAFPKGGVEVWVTRGNRISEEAMATLPPRSWGDFTGERAVWEGKFHTK